MSDEQLPPALAAAQDSLNNTTVKLTCIELDVCSSSASAQDDTGDHSPLSPQTALSSAVDGINSPQTTQEDSAGVDPQTMDVCLSSPAKQDDLASIHDDTESVSSSPCVSAEAAQYCLVPSPQSSTTNVLPAAVQEATPATTSVNNSTQSSPTLPVKILRKYFNHDHTYLCQAPLATDSECFSPVSQKTTPNLVLSSSPSLSVMLGSHLCKDECLTASPQTISSTASDALLASPTSQDEQLGITVSDSEMLDSPLPVHGSTQSEDDVLADSPLPAASQKVLSTTSGESTSLNPSLDHVPSVLDSSPGMCTQITIKKIIFYDLSSITTASQGGAVTSPSAQSSSVPATSSQGKGEVSEEMDIDDVILTEPDTQHLAASVRISASVSSGDPLEEDMEQDHENEIEKKQSSQFKPSSAEKPRPLSIDDSELLDSDEMENDIVAVHALDNCEFDILHQKEEVPSKPPNTASRSQTLLARNTTSEDDVFELDGLLQEEMGVSTVQEGAPGQTSQDDVFELDGLLQEEMGVLSADKEKKETSPSAQLGSARVGVMVSPTSTCRKRSLSTSNTDQFDGMLMDTASSSSPENTKPASRPPGENAPSCAAIELAESQKEKGACTSTKQRSLKRKIDVLPPSISSEVEKPHTSKRKFSVRKKPSKISPSETRSKEQVQPTKPKEQVKPTKPKEKVQPSKPKEKVQPSKPKQQVLPSKPKEQVQPSKPKEQVLPKNRYCHQNLKNMYSHQNLKNRYCHQNLKNRYSHQNLKNRYSHQNLKNRYCRQKQDPKSKYCHQK